MVDAALIAWGRAVAVRRPCPFPPLWLFTDAVRLKDPRPAVARLPKGLAGVVLRHDAAPGRRALGRDLARLCRARRLALVVAGDPRLAAALGAGLHIRRGRLPLPRPRSGLVTASAHGRAELVRAARAGADLVFLGPAFATASHPAARPLGAAGWNRLARSARVPVAALGGITGRAVRALPAATAAGAIGALA
ncbi:MAG TPA: thiamine phosphate synthase [Acetobacteraceae bacterium]|jgi:thiamine-phosphate pyrophosphorylase|nr:thiamine phosphate synthase [Acetobacteraceae bacterium]